MIKLRVLLWLFSKNVDAIVFLSPIYVVLVITEMKYLTLSTKEMLLLNWTFTNLKLSLMAY